MRGKVAAESMPIAVSRNRLVISRPSSRCTVQKQPSSSNDRARDLAAELHVAAQIELFNDVIEVAQVSGWPAKCSLHSHSSSSSLEKE